MSRFPDDLLRLARALAQVPGIEPNLSLPGAKAALQARSTTLWLVTAMVASMGVGTHTSIDELSYGRRLAMLRVLARASTAPMSSLGVLARIEARLGEPAPDAGEISLTQLLNLEPATAYEERWLEVLTAAAAARGSFEALPMTRLDRTAKAGWVVATEAAALAGAVCALDESLLPACAAADATVGGSVGVNYLRTAAQAVSRAAPEHMPSLDSILSAATAQTVTVGSGRDLIDAMDRLPQLLNSQPDLQVADIRQTCVVLSLGLDLAGRVLQGDQAQRAQALGDAVNSGARGHPQVREVLPGEHQVSSDLQVQLAGMVSFLARSRLLLEREPGRAESMQPTFAGFVQFAPAAVHACLRRVRRHLDAATWASTVGPADLALQPFAPPLPSHHHDLWHRLTRTPRLLSALRSAAQLAGPDRRPVLSAPVQEGVSARTILGPINTPRQSAFATDLDTRYCSRSDELSPSQLDDLVRRSLLPEEPPEPAAPMGALTLPPLLPMAAASTCPDLSL